MSTQRIALLALVLTLIALGSTGCLMRRTVREGDSVVAQGYIVKTPLIDR